MLNNQPPEKFAYLSDGKNLDIQEIFLTIQGEGPFTGYPAVFIRLAGCNLQCPGCDTDYTSNRRQMHLKDIIKIVHQLKSDSAVKLVVITGGEPFRQNITPLTDILLNCGYSVQVETNGTLSPSSGLDDRVVIVCSPKTGSLNTLLALKVDAYKYVLDKNNVEPDGLPTSALDHPVPKYLARPLRNFQGPIYLQPRDEKDENKNKDNLNACLASCYNSGYILQLQLHKIIGVE